MNYLMFTMQYTKYDVGRKVAMTMLPPPPTKPITLPSVVLAWEEKKKSTLGYVRAKGTEVSYGKIAFTTVAVTQDLQSGMPSVLKI